MKIPFMLALLMCLSSLSLGQIFGRRRPFYQRQVNPHAARLRVARHKAHRGLPERHEFDAPHTAKDASAEQYHHEEYNPKASRDAFSSNFEHPNYDEKLAKPGIVKPRPGYVRSYGGPHRFRNVPLPQRGHRESISRPLRYGNEGRQRPTRRSMFTFFQDLRRLMFS